MVRPLPGLRGPTSCRQACSGLQQGPQGQTPRLHCHLLALTSAMDTLRGPPCRKSSTGAVPSGPSQGDTRVWQERLQQDRMGSLTRTVRISRGESGPAPPEGPGASFRTTSALLHHLRPVLQPSPFSDHPVFSHTTAQAPPIYSASQTQDPCSPSLGLLLSLWRGPDAPPWAGARAATPLRLRNAAIPAGGCCRTDRRRGRGHTEQRGTRSGTQRVRWGM